MSAIKIYTDEHVATAVVRGLRRRGIDAVSAGEAHMLGTSDPEHLEYAASQQRVVVTQDDDFIRLHAANHDHHGIAYAPQGTTIGEMINGVMFLYQYLDAADMLRRLEYLQKHLS